MPACWALAIQSKSCVPVLCTVFDNVRSNVPHMLLDDVFTAKEEIATSVKEELVRAAAHVPCTSLSVMGRRFCSTQLLLLRW